MALTAAGRAGPPARGARPAGGRPGIDRDRLNEAVDRIANRWPTVGLAVGVVGPSGLEFFRGQGLADIASSRPVTTDTIFRIASLTKTMTAVAVMQLVERGLVELDAPAGEYLRSYELVPRRSTWRPPTVRHLLTHTAGIRELLHLRDIVRMRDLGDAIPLGRRLPSLAERYGGRLRVDAEPGTVFTYTNHGFNTLGQIVEDVTGLPLSSYFRDEIFTPLGMTDTGLDRGRLDESRFARPYELRRKGAVAVADYQVISPGGGGVSSTPADMVRYLAALLNGGANDRGAVLRPESLAAMFAPHYQPDPRVPGIGLAFFRQTLGDHLVVEHDGILPGFDTHLSVVPEAGIAVMAFANGARRGMLWLGAPVAGLLRDVLEVPREGIRDDVPQRPELWRALCGRYRFSALAADPGRLAFWGAHVFVGHGQLGIRFLGPSLGLLRGSELLPDDPLDPYTFRIRFPWFGIDTTRVFFTRGADDAITGVHLEAGPLSFPRIRP
jgi:CubicO group peptidase (beta-lactamase class C family)